MQNVRQWRNVFAHIMSDLVLHNIEIISIAVMILVPEQNESF